MTIMGSVKENVAFFLLRSGTLASVGGELKLLLVLEKMTPA